MATSRLWTITTSGDRSLEQIAKDLAEAGLQDREILEMIGVITGSAEDESVEKLRRVRGVTDVSLNLMIQLEPPDSDQTW